MNRILADEFRRFGANRWNAQNSGSLNLFFLKNNMHKHIQQPIHAICEKNVIVPRKATVGSAGFDLWMHPEFCDKQIEVPSGALVMIPTGVKMCMPSDLHATITTRSSTFKKGCLIEGTIDSDYTGEVMIQLRNTGSRPVIFQKDQAIAQILIHRTPKAYFHVEQKDVVQPGPFDRERHGGWGSTNPALKRKDAPASDDSLKAGPSKPWTVKKKAIVTVPRDLSVNRQQSEPDDTDGELTPVYEEMIVIDDDVVRSPFLPKTPPGVKPSRPPPGRECLEDRAALAAFESSIHEQVKDAPLSSSTGDQTDGFTLGKSTTSVTNIYNQHHITDVSNRQGPEVHARDNKLLQKKQLLDEFTVHL